MPLTHIFCHSFSQSLNSLAVLLGTALLAVRHDAYISFARHNNPHAMNPLLMLFISPKWAFWQETRPDNLISATQDQSCSPSQLSTIILFVQVAEGLQGPLLMLCQRSRQFLRVVLKVAKFVTLIQRIWWLITDDLSVVRAEMPINESTVFLC